jgi:uncharacterized membrane protein YqjE
MSDGSKEAGFFRHAVALFSAGFEYLEARLQLAGLEAKEASLLYAVVLALLVGALVVVTFGYFFLCLAIVFLLAWLFGDGHAWIWVTLGMAVLHFGGAAACVLIAKGKFARPVFSATLNQFRKDQEWLNSQAAKPS